MKGAELTVATRGNKMIVGSLREVATGNVIFMHDTSKGTPIDQIEKDLNK